MSNLHERKQAHDAAIAMIGMHFQRVLGDDFIAIIDVEKIGGMYTGLCHSTIGKYRFIAIPFLNSMNCAPPLANLIARKKGFE